MNDQDWRSMASAPKDGTRILVAIRSSEQGPAEVDVARWAKPDKTAEECWVAGDSDPEAPITYADTELSSWMPLPSPVPPLRSGAKEEATVSSSPRQRGEIGGSGI
jgi:hypothetical protein